MFGEVIGWLLALASVMWIPIVACYKLRYSATGSFAERLRFLLTPNAFELKRVAKANGVDTTVFDDDDSSD